VQISLALNLWYFRFFFRTTFRSSAPALSLNRTFRDDRTFRHLRFVLERTTGDFSLALKWLLDLFVLGRRALS
jgi:hypothetical protein